ncbi:MULTISPECIES: oligosaccharyl transferase, archaeosortase A system-associated [unclassified Methanoregula]|uniref:oligosaccharyl transferase, archaeosortase A system-associated n=1 Tax=unclassified Methanoregula TaxID=2649730 RepID=UPI0009C87185|nr:MULTISPECIES: oligosaccharyl transferase, archaeosortase A system-associated [unclassified Methanoregula]OPX65151.1 MAG: Dolichyl-monophosphooligosaccharide--protein glycosyltransferase AglB [Methanoregula sp. PtaB.Bin085]OPY32063.1 MAG: Dolichyl-monophosphooligosaccharide--protein glycosyltransferase AglB [Methanoregula sp. PtaU1.Bin006]
MDITALNKYRQPVTVAFILLFMAVALIIRIIPALITGNQPFFPVYDTDTWYNLRQIEVMVHDFPQYNWFDPMTAYPAGKTIDWGPGLPFVAALLCLITGAVTRDAIVAASGFVAPLMAVLLVPTLYFLGLRIADRKTGIVAAGLISFTSFLYFTFSSYGMVDHHIAEVLFSTLFILVYLETIAYSEAHRPDRKNRNTLLTFAGLCVLAGILYFAALITSTTVLLVLLVVALFTVIQNIVDFLSGKDPEYLCILNLLALGTTIVLLLISGFRHEGLSIMNYSSGLVLAHGAVAAGSLLLYILAKAFRGRRTHYFLVLAGIIIAGLVISQVVPVFQQLVTQAQHLLFGYSAFSIGVQETLPWSFAGAYDAINVAILLVAGGFLVLGYCLTKKPERAMVFFAVWSVAMLLLTFQFQRFLYYFTVNIALLSALCITEPFRWDQGGLLRKIAVFSNTPEPDAEKSVSENQPDRHKTGKKRKAAAPGKSTPGIPDTLKAACLVIVCFLAIIHAGLSLSQDIRFAAAAHDREIPADWLESLGWLKSGTPDPGIGYFDRYDSRNYSAPAGSYGILAIWDAGHWITFFAHRMPVTNPFQDNLAGESGTAAFFLSDNEARANGIIEKYQGKYVITDSTLAVSTFTNLVPWMSGSGDISSYIRWFLVPDPKDGSHLKKIHLFNDGYYRTMVARLYVFDGSMTVPSTAEYVKYTIRKPTSAETAEASGFSRVITGRQTINLSLVNMTGTPIIPEGPELLPTSYADLYSDMPDKPLSTLPALVHYRLVHESPDDATVTPFPESAPFIMNGIKTVKIFEYVRGAHIPGEGIIELRLVTNTGRTFVYRQESSGGEFIVPYSTKGNPCDVRATGPYRIIGTSRTFEVTEDAVVQGLTVNG